MQKLTKLKKSKKTLSGIGYIVALLIFIVVISEGLTTQSSLQFWLILGGLLCIVTGAVLGIKYLEKKIGRLELEKKGN